MDMNGISTIFRYSKALLLGSRPLEFLQNPLSLRKWSFVSLFVPAAFIYAPISKKCVHPRSQESPEVPKSCRFRVSVHSVTSHNVSYAMAETGNHPVRQLSLSGISFFLLSYNRPTAKTPLPTARSKSVPRKTRWSQNTVEISMSKKHPKIWTKKYSVSHGQFSTSKAQD